MSAGVQGEHCGREDGDAVLEQGVGLNPDSNTYSVDSDKLLQTLQDSVPTAIRLR